MLVSAVWQSESAIHIHISPYPLPLTSPSHPPYPTPLGGHKAPSWSPCAMRLLPTSYLFYIWQCIYVHATLSLRPSLPSFSPGPQVHSLCLRLYSCPAPRFFRTIFFFFLDSIYMWESDLNLVWSMAWALGFLKSLHVILTAAKLENYNSLAFDSDYDTILLGSLKKNPKLEPHTLRFWYNQSRVGHGHVKSSPGDSNVQLVLRTIASDLDKQDALWVGDLLRSPSPHSSPLLPEKGFMGWYGGHFLLSPVRLWPQSLGLLQWSKPWGF